MLRLVHVSDIHFRHGPGWDVDADQRDQLIVDLEGVLQNDGETVDGILVGGDVAFSGQREQYEDAMEWLENMIKASGCPKGGVWVVPGNHDVEWSVVGDSTICKEFRDTVRECELTELDELLNVRMAVDAAGAGLIEPFHEYNQFAKDWGCETSAREREWYDSLGSMDDAPVVLWGLNSAFVSDEHDADDGQNPNLVLGSHQCKLKERHGEIRIVICHHPPGRLKDWEQVAAYLERAHLFLFGHEHDFNCDQPRERGPVWIHAGAVVPEAGGERVASYNLLRLELENEDARLTVQARVWSEADKRFVARGTDYEPFTIARDLRTLGEMDLPSEAEEPTEEEPTAATPLGPSKDSEPKITVDEQARLRQIAVAYMSAPVTKRLEIAERLSVLEDSDFELPTDRERYGAILTRIRDRDLIDKLAEELGL